MGWEKRGNREYLYRKRRIGRRVVSEYVGRGEIAELMEELDGLDRIKRDLRTAQAAAARERERDIDAEIDRLGRLARAMTFGAFLLNGYHAHKGQWRKRQDGNENEHR